MSAALRPGRLPRSDRRPGAGVCARRDLVLRTPLRTGETTGSFALRSPVRPNLIASSVVALAGIEGTTVRVRGLDCLDATPLLDLKPDRGASPA